MSTYDSAALECAVTDDSIDLDRRDARALSECMTVRALGGDIYSVTTASGSEYRVDAREARCTCPDHKHRDARCKHLRRVAFATGDVPIPCWVTADAVDPLLGQHVEGACVATTDGGVVLDAETDDAGRPDDCSCSEFEGKYDLPCFPCYRDGFKSPTSNERTED